MTLDLVTRLIPWLGIAGLVFWIGWHVLQAKVEAKELADAERDFNAEHSSASIDRY